MVMELRRIIHKGGALVNECGSGDWCRAALFQLNNKEAFRELVFDLKCCWEAVHEIYSTKLPNPQNCTECKDFNVATLKEVESDEQDLQKKLENVLEDSKEHILAKHLLKRLKCDLQQVRGGELDALEIPKDFPKPELVKLKGDGGFGSVYESKWLGLPSATKTLAVPNDCSGFRKEVGILAGLSHPNLIKYFCCGIDEERNELHLVMELMDMNLTQMLEERNKRLLPYVVAIDVMLQIGSGMWYLHDMHVAHLDLKPGNVLLSSMAIDGAKHASRHHCNVKLIDYGTSKLEVRSKPQTQKVQYIVGTPNYMAPEQMVKNVACMTCPFQADVWSFAMTCSHILSQKVPFHPTNTLKEILPKIKEGERPELPINCGELTQLIEECWREDPLQRPTFADICKRLIGLKKMFMKGTYLNDMVPQFGEVRNFSQKNSTTSEGCKEETNHGSEKVNATSITMCSLLKLFSIHYLL
jgi:serine/threonine protein kinase